MPRSCVIDVGHRPAPCQAAAAEVVTDAEEKGRAAEQRRLVERTLAGDQLAQRQLVAVLRSIFEAVATVELKPWRSRRIGTMGKDDLVSEVFAALFKNDARALRSFDAERGSLETFGFVFARSRIRELTKKQLRRQAIIGTPVSVEDAPPTASGTRPDELAEAKDLARAVLECVRAAFKTELGQRMVRLILERLLDLDDIEAESGMSRRQVYQWRNRVFSRAATCKDEISERAGSATP